VRSRTSGVLISVMAVLPVLAATAVFAQSAAPPPPVPSGPSEELVKWTIQATLVCITLSWLGIVGFVGIRGDFHFLVDLIKTGPLIKFVTVTYIVIAVAILGMLKVIDADNVSALLGSIAGYILGQATSPRAGSESTAPKLPKSRTPSGTSIPPGPTTVENLLKVNSGVQGT
jgi:hypothetical protein